MSSEVRIEDRLRELADVLSKAAEEIVRLRCECEVLATALQKMLDEYATASGRDLPRISYKQHLQLTPAASNARAALTRYYRETAK